MPKFATTGSYSNVILTSDDVHATSFSSKTKSILLYIIRQFHYVYGQPFEEAAPIAARLETPEIKWRTQYTLSGLLCLIQERFPYAIRHTSKGASITDMGECILKFTFGEGSRTNKSGGGKAGMTFEEDLFDRLSGNLTPTELTDRIRFTLERDCGMILSSCRYFREGSRNQKRTFEYRDGRLRFDRTGDIGDLITDISVDDGNRRNHLSLKHGDQYYLINLSLRKILHLDDVDRDNSERNNLLKDFGFCPVDFCRPYGIVSSDVGWRTNTEVESFWLDLIRDVVGYGYLYVIGGDGHERVLNFVQPPDIRIDQIMSPVYAESGVRKYSKISIYCKISELYYRIDAQFRGTFSTDRYPVYMRLLATKIKEPR